MPDGEVLRDAAADVVPDDRRTLDPERVEHLQQTLRVPFDADVAAPREITASEPEQVDDDDAVPGRHVRNDILPEVRRGRESVYEEDGIPVSARSGGVVVEPRT